MDYNTSIHFDAHSGAEELVRAERVVEAVAEVLRRLAPAEA